MVIVVLSEHSTFDDDASDAHLESDEDYGPARNLANSLPRFSGTSKHVDFDAFEQAFIEKAQFIPKDAKRSKIFIQLLLDRVLEPAKSLLIGKAIEQPTDILQILSSTYGVSLALEDIYNEIEGAEKDWNETVGNYLRRLNRLVKKGVKIAAEEYGIEHKNTYKEKLNTKALDRFMEYFDFGTISEVLEDKEVRTVKQALKILENECPRVVHTFWYYDASSESEKNIFEYYDYHHEDTSSAETGSKSGETSEGGLDVDCSPPTSPRDQHIHSDSHELASDHSCPRQAYSVDISESPIVVEILQQLSKINFDLQNIKDLLTKFLPELRASVSHHSPCSSCSQQSCQPDEESSKGSTHGARGRGRTRSTSKSSSASEEKLSVRRHYRKKSKCRRSHYKKRSSRH